MILYDILISKLPNDLKKILMLMVCGIGGTWAQELLDVSYNKYFYRRKKWLHDYVIFLHLCFKLDDEIKRIFKEIGYWKNGKKKSGFKIFEYIWKNPFYHSRKYAKKFKKSIVFVKQEKGKYVKKMKEYINSQEMQMLLYYFDKICFKPFGQKIVKTYKSKISKRKAKEEIKSGV